MEVIFYKTDDGVNVINKVITNPISIDVMFRGDVDFNSLEIKLADSEGIYRDYNYCYIPSLDRYYYLYDSIINKGVLITLFFNCDVLETYKTTILNSNARFLRGIKTGDYARVSLDISELKTISSHVSDGDGFGEGSSMIITTLGV